MKWFAPFAAALVAQGLGLQDDDVTFTRTAGSDEQYDTLLADGCDAVVTAMDNVFAWNRRAGSPGDFCIVAQIERTTPLMVVAQPHVQTLAQLRGGTLLVDAPGNGFVIALRALLLVRGGLAWDACSLLEAGGVKERLDALLAGRGDATLLGPPFHLPALAAGKRVLATVQEHFPHFPGQGLVVRRAALARIRPALSRWLAQLDHAGRHAQVDAQAGLAALRQASGLDIETATAMLRGLPASLRPDRVGVELLVAMRRELGLPGGEDAYEALVDASALPEGAA